MSYKNIYTIENKDLLKIIIDRPDKLNALNEETISELSDAFMFAESRKDVRVIILTGEGEKAFAAGADISEFENNNQQQGTKIAAKAHDTLFDVVENLSTPVIAAINGFALGGGLELAMSAHFRVASNNAKMGLPETSLGLIPGYGGTQRLTQLVGKGKAMEMIMTAGMINAKEAYNNGLVNHVVTQDNLIPFCEKIALKIMNNSSIAIAHAIRSINAYNEKETDGYKLEIELFGKCFETEDFKEGINAFLAKRKADFPGK